MIARGAIRNPWIFRALKPLPHDDEWPSLDEVDVAAAAYFARAEQNKTREKYVEFHRRNFARLRKAARSGDRSGAQTLLHTYFSVTLTRIFSATAALPDARSIHFS